jgi:hypothetical protein
MVYLNDTLMSCVVWQVYGGVDTAVGRRHHRIFFWLKEFGMYISFGMLAVIVMIAYILGIVTAAMLYSWQDRDE